MYKKVIVPLDGSKLAEVALPHLEEIAKKFNIPDILLVSVTEEIKGDIPRGLVVEDASTREFHMAPVPTENFPLGSTHMGQTGMIFSVNSSHLTPMPTRMGKMAKTASNYLIKVAKDLESKGLNSTIVILTGNPAEEIVRFAKDQNADLIIMGSRGKSGFNRWDMGNIADKVLRATEIPVVLVKPGRGFKETKAKRHGKPS
jgi:nucleotide-binding universal stress UspA family protein